MSGDRSWIVPGAKVAVFTPRFGAGSVKFDEIDRILKRDIVLKSGLRYYFRRDWAEFPEQAGAGSSYMPRPYLLPPEHIRVRQVETAGRESLARSAVVKAYDSWRAVPTIEKANTITAAVSAWVELQEVTQ